MPVVGGKVDSVSIGGKEFAVAEGSELDWSVDGDDDGPVVLSSSKTVVLTFRMKRTAKTRRFEWHMRHLHTRRMRRKPCAGKIERTLKAALREALRPFRGMWLTDVNQDACKKAVVSAAEKTLGQLGVKGWVPSVAIPPPPEPINVELSFGFAFPRDGG